VGRQADAPKTFAFRVGRDSESGIGFGGPSGLLSEHLLEGSTVTKPTPDAGRPATGSAAADSRDLATFGYRQELARTLGSFSAFAAGFAYLSLLTGIFQLFWLGYDAGGPAFFWTWPVVFLGQFLVALCFAELAAHYPLAGGVYQWSRHVGSRATGFLTGWTYLASLVITVAAVALALQETLPAIHPWFHLVHNPARNAVLLGCVLIVVTTLINIAGVRLVAAVNNLGVFAELVGASLLIVLLLARAMRGPAVVFDTAAKGTPPFGYLGPALAAALMASYVMYGFDTAGTLAEETTEPRKKAPRAILQALAAAGVGGALLILGALMAAPTMPAPELADEGGGMPWLVGVVLGGLTGKVFLCIVTVAITSCALAAHTGVVRLMFAMARDNDLPFGHALARVSGTTQTPVVPSLVVGGGAAGILLVNAVLPALIDQVVPVAILWANLAYLIVTVPLLVLRLRGWPARGGSGVKGLFSLGRWGLAVNALAVAWGIFMVVNLGWPRPGPACYAPILFTLGLLAVGGLYYGLVQRHKTGVLPEHRASSHKGGCAGE
jgi:urea carboxylase system permease